MRNPGGPDGPSEFFGDERSELRAGWCKLQDVDVGGLAPVLEAVPAFVREQFLRVDDVRVLDPADLLDSLQNEEAAAPPALFVHGYFIDFEKGCRRASLFQDNASLTGRLLWFSWPSDGDIANYARDEADLYWSVPDLADAIIELDRRAGDDGGIHVLGHSLGGRGVVLALQEVAHRHPDIRLGEVVLLAPDMDFEIFSRILPRIAQIANAITVYVTDEDRPLALSAQLHGYPRLGQAGNDVASLSGLEVIDLSGLPNESPSGHLYHIHNPQVGDDLDRLLNNGLRAAERPNLVQTGPNSWNLRQ
ncbi:MAG: alpha/beta fold hydrolase [Paracoccaceae bacterium]|nr:alpha/beta fold hydrolase [Paracoccaceae bacterium]